MGRGGAMGVAPICVALPLLKVAYFIQQLIQQLNQLEASEVNGRMMWSVAVLLFLSCAYAHTRGQHPSAGSCELQRCTPSMESLSTPFTNEEDAVVDARCLLVCVEEVRLHDNGS